MKASKQVSKKERDKETSEVVLKGWIRYEICHGRSFTGVSRDGMCCTKLRTPLQALTKSTKCRYTWRLKERYFQKQTCDIGSTESLFYLTIIMFTLPRYCVARVGSRRSGQRWCGKRSDRKLRSTMSDTIMNIFIEYKGRVLRYVSAFKEALFSNISIF
jgi:hypothetical protein